MNHYIYIRIFLERVNALRNGR